MVANRSLQLFREFKYRVVILHTSVILLKEGWGFQKSRLEGWLKIQRFEKKNASNVKYKLKRSVVDRCKRL